MKLEHFLDFLTSELRENGLLHIIDTNESKRKELDEETLESQQFQVRDIMINHIDSYYHSKVVKIKDPVALLSKIKELKNYETNLTSGTIRKQLYSILYTPTKEKASEFIDKFEDIVRNYDNLTGVQDLTDLEKKRRIL